MLFSLASISQATSAPENDMKYGFATRDYFIEMKITFDQRRKDRTMHRAVCGCSSRCEIFSQTREWWKTRSGLDQRARDSFRPILRSPAAASVFHDAKTGERNRK